MLMNNEQSWFQAVASKVLDLHLKETQNLGPRCSPECDTTDLTPIQPRKVPYLPPYHRKKRIRKKWEKEYKATYFFLNYVSSLSVPRGFCCRKCGRNHGFYQTMARRVIQIQPMPEGALAIYDKTSG